MSSLTEQQIERLTSWLFDHPRPAGVTVSDHIQTAAAAGDSDAVRLLATGVLREPTWAEVTPARVSAVLELLGKEPQKPARRPAAEPGKRFGSWTVTSLAPKRGSNSYAWCLCECMHLQQVALNALRSGKSRGCKTCAYRRQKGRAKKLRSN